MSLFSMYLVKYNASPGSSNKNELEITVNIIEALRNSNIYYNMIIINILPIR